MNLSLSSFHLDAVNNFDPGECCSIASFLSKLRSLDYVDLDIHITPSSCIEDGDWARAGLTVPPDEVVSQGWERVIKFLRAGTCVPVHELRLMLIGDGEVGKTSLAKAFHSDDRSYKRIPKEQRTIGIDISSLSLTAEDPTITCQVCDCAGQEVYHLSHTLHFTRRCLYVEP